MRWNIVFPGRTEAGDEFFMNRPCQHCQEAPCTRVCPVAATWKRSDGIVAMDYDRCIGCRYCQVACPYDVRRFNWYEVTAENPYVPAWGTPDKEVPRRPRGVVEKCTLATEPEYNATGTADAISGACWVAFEVSCEDATATADAGTRAAPAPSIKATMTPAPSATLQPPPTLSSPAASPLRQSRADL